MRQIGNHKSSSLGVQLLSPPFCFVCKQLTFRVLKTLPVGLQTRWLTVDLASYRAGAASHSGCVKCVIALAVQGNIKKANSFHVKMNHDENNTCKFFCFKGYKCSWYIASDTS